MMAACKQKSWKKQCSCNFLKFVFIYLPQINTLEDRSQKNEHSF